ncbi:MAG: hypothetical protein J7M40_10955, partial [Planctomycetes bacterium]|nr:hypothetical protein [Planctomycetota bacterium]
MVTVEYRKLIRLLFVWLVAALLLATGCEPEEEILSSASSSKQAVSEAEQTKPPVVDLVCQRILKGDFDTAEKLIASLDGAANPQIAQLSRIVAEYESIQAQSDSSKKESLAEQMDKLDELRKKFEPDYVVDANDIGEIISVVIR